MEILIRNLPGDVTEQQLRDYLHPFGEVDEITLTNEGNSERTSATVATSFSTAVAEKVCERIGQKPLDDHHLRAEVVLFFK